MAGLMLLVTMMAMNVSSQPIYSGVMTSGGGGFLALIKNLAQVAFESFLEWAEWQFLTQEASNNVNSSYTKVLVVTGAPRAKAKKTELIPSSQNEDCHLPDFPISLINAVGFPTAQGPIICGGLKADWKGDWSNNKECFILNGQGWTHWASMITARADAAVVKLNDDKSIILGGKNENDDRLSSSEILSSNGVEDVEINFPVTIAFHCMMRLSESVALVTGGYQRGSMSASTWIVNTESKMVTRGPRMEIGRSSHGCATLHLGNKTFGLVAGGSGRKDINQIRKNRALLYEVNPTEKGNRHGIVNVNKDSASCRRPRRQPTPNFEKSSQLAEIEMMY